jgi:PKHD-type hydroxylase
MLLQIAQPLPPALLAECQAMAAEHQAFGPGKATAGWHARERKHNLQAQGDPAVQALLARVADSLVSHPLLRSAARPRTVVRLMLCRYDSGMYYGTHVDDALMDGQRTDLSFTLFLNSAQDYEGGRLVIDEPAGERAFAMLAGDMLLYPATSLHRVEPVTSGCRLVLVGWIRSFIRSAEAREILFDLDRVIAALRAGNSASDSLELLLKTRSNLLRLWAEE